MRLRFMIDPWRFERILKLVAAGKITQSKNPRNAESAEERKSVVTQTAYVPQAVKNDRGEEGCAIETSAMRRLHYALTNDSLTPALSANSMNGSHVQHRPCRCSYVSSSGRQRPASVPRVDSLRSRH